jgi:hypothetical protein
MAAWQHHHHQPVSTLTLPSASRSVAPPLSLPLHPPLEHSRCSCVVSFTAECP